MGRFVRGFQFDLSLHVAMVWTKNWAFLGLFTQLLTQAAPFPPEVCTWLEILNETFG